MILFFWLVVECFSTKTVNQKEKNPLNIVTGEIHNWSLANSETFKGKETDRSYVNQIKELLQILLSVKKSKKIRCSSTKRFTSSHHRILQISITSFDSLQNTRNKFYQFFTRRLRNLSFVIRRRISNIWYLISEIPLKKFYYQILRGYCKKAILFTLELTGAQVIRRKFKMVCRITLLKHIPVNLINIWLTRNWEAGKMI